MSDRDACMRCGRTLKAHEEDQERHVPSEQLASEWLNRAGYKGAPYFDLVRVVLTRYIEDQRK